MEGQKIEIKASNKGFAIIGLSFLCIAIALYVVSLVSLDRDVLQIMGKIAFLLAILMLFAIATNPSIDLYADKIKTATWFKKNEYLLSDMLSIKPGVQSMKPGFIAEFPGKSIFIPYTEEAEKVCTEWMNSTEVQ